MSWGSETEKGIKRQIERELPSLDQLLLFSFSLSLCLLCGTCHPLSIRVFQPCQWSLFGGFLSINERNVWFSLCALQHQCHLLLCDFFEGTYATRKKNLHAFERKKMSLDISVTFESKSERSVHDFVGVEQPKTLFNQTIDRKANSSACWADQTNTFLN